MDGWPSYWEAMIPMHYATHVVSPCLGMVNGLAEYVSCFGSGTVRDDIAQKSGNKFAVESCHIKIKDNDLSAHIWRFLYDVARQYRESIDLANSRTISVNLGSAIDECFLHAILQTTNSHFLVAQSLFHVSDTDHVGIRLASNVVRLT